LKYVNNANIYVKLSADSKQNYEYPLVACFTELYLTNPSLFHYNYADNILLQSEIWNSIVANRIELK
jgi:hypothetical protein